MGKNIKVKKKEGKVPAKATETKRVSADNQEPVFSFTKTCSRHCQLSQWRNHELSLLVNAFKTMGQLKWKDIRKHRGLKYTHISRKQLSIPLPEYIPEDATISEVRVDDHMRLFGYRSDKIFNIIWFDREHKVLPYHKQRAK